ncbi:SDR family NAD(P)-dependent oxidoreductase [Nonomuraea mesophila]|uniref:SDR family NAD(P)-dependent oxidoreductase n=1 Tax=Nonomuraea mesophila TaxID=2530382 RepID=A0A4R5FX91_9ACTN|nr:SDR family NAD(P)-dependent oxidoreductase [Nonomuraea mesophila]TDE59655.1 SDR family NAD(P)-dependent oxidoreductase [Nonomuraea mesophila]
MASGRSGNAGILLPGLLSDGSPGEWERQMELNLTGLLRFIHALMPDLLEAASTGGAADIVNISSAAAGQVEFGAAVYAATKAAVSHLSRHFRQELAPLNVRVTDVRPGTAEARGRAGMRRTPVSISACIRRIHFRRIMSSRFPLRTTRPARRRWPAAVVLAAALAVTAAGVPGPAAAAPASGGPSVDKYLGTWNYDQPDRGSMRNVAELKCPDTRPGCDSANPLAPAGSTWQIPQIGRIVFSTESRGRVVGRTDRGCTWRFTARRGSLELDPPRQSCENQVIKSGYTITSWSVTVSGRHERETIKGVSHNRRGEFDFVLERGARTKAEQEPPAKVAKRFAGQWKYAPADPSQLVNFATYLPGRPDATPKLTPQRGLVEMTVKPDRTGVARTADGCEWTMTAWGNTAELNPPGQTCKRSGKTITMGFWQVAGDGRLQASIMNGVVRQAGLDSGFVLNVGALTRR